MTAAWVSWSSGKDSAFALHHALEQPDVEVVGLLTTVNETVDRVHGVRRILLERQARALGLELNVIQLPSPCPNEVYEQRMRAAVARARESSIGKLIYGDLFLEDVRAYRERNLQGTGIEPMFPLWGRPTHELAGQLIDAGFRAIVSCVDLSKASAGLAGRWYGPQLLADLPPDVDPCGENGEFHTVVVDSPDFAAPIPVTVGEVVERDGYAFADVIPVENV